MRLIDAELTAKNIAKYRSIALECGNAEMNKMMECYINPTAFSDGVSYGMELAQKVVSGQPTAYDIDKVVEQLEKAKAEFSGGTLQEHYYWKGIEDAIEIVKEGGAV